MQANTCICMKTKEKRKNLMKTCILNSKANETINRNYELINVNRKEPHMSSERILLNL